MVEIPSAKFGGTDVVYNPALHDTGNRLVFLDNTSNTLKRLSWNSSLSLWDGLVESSFNTFPTSDNYYFTNFFQSSLNCNQMVFRQDSVNGLEQVFYVTLIEDTFGTPIELIGDIVDNVFGKVASISKDGTTICVIVTTFVDGIYHFNLEIWDVESLTDDPTLISSTTDIIDAFEPGNNIANAYPNYMVIDTNNSNLYFDTIKPVLLSPANTFVKTLHKISISDTPKSVYSLPTCQTSVDFHHRAFTVADSTGLNGRTIFYVQQGTSLCNVYLEWTSGNGLDLFQTIEFVDQNNPATLIESCVISKKGCSNCIVISSTESLPRIYKFNSSKTKWQFVRDLDLVGSGQTTSSYLAYANNFSTIRLFSSSTAGNVFTFDVPST